MLTPEGRVKAKVKKILHWAEVYYHMPVQNGMGRMSLDFICCRLGVFFAIETKAEGNKLTLRQAKTAREIEQAGGRVFVVYDTPTDWSLVDLYEFLYELSP